MTLICPDCCYTIPVQRVFRRPAYFLWLIIPGIWLLWLWTAYAWRSAMSLPLGLVDFLAAAAFFYMSRDFHIKVQHPIRGMGLGIAALGIGDLLYTIQKQMPGFPQWLSEGFFLAGAVGLVIYGFSLPYGLYRLGLYRRSRFEQAILIPLILGTLAIAVLGRFEVWRDAFAPGYAFVCFSLLGLFVVQVIQTGQSHLKNTLQRVMWALVLVSLARVVSVLGGLNPSELMVNLFGLLWMLGMSIVVLAVTD